MNPVLLAVVLGVLAFGFNTLFWSSVGAGRYLLERGLSRRGAHVGWRPSPSRVTAPQPADVAILIAAHNEEAGIANTIRSAARLVSRSQIYVVSDGSTDGTARIARQNGVQVLELIDNVGKASALTIAFLRFQLSERVEIVTLLDADSELSSDYLSTGLRLFVDPTVAVVAAGVTTQWDPTPGNWRARILIGHRERAYVLMQRLLKYGQAARRADVVAIAPGFASMYRSSVLAQIRMDPVGLVIEDFNMTFEVHRHRLGRVVFNPSIAVARTQDPDRFADYRRQVSRWALGFWQTVRLQGLLHRGRFWVALTAWCVELVLSSLALFAGVGLLLARAGFALARLAGAHVASPSWLPAAWLILLMLAAPHVLLSIAVAVLQRRPSMLLFAPVFFLLAIVDAWLAIGGLARSYTTSSTGQWRSPPRRSTDVVTVGPLS